MDADDYDRLFDEVRYALTKDVGYSILLAKAGQNIINRQAQAAERKAARVESDSENPQP